MKAAIVASSLLLPTALACAGPVQPATTDAPAMQDIRWHAEPVAGERGQPTLRLTHKTSTSDLSLGADIAGKRPEFAAARGALGQAGPVRFTVRHAAGMLACSGDVARAYDGEGRCSFAPDAGFARALADRGLPLRSDADQLSMLMVDATVALADGLIDAGVRPDEADDLIAAAALDLTGAYVRDLKASRLVLTDIDDAIACKALGVDGAYVRGLAAAGYTKLDADEVLGMKALGVSPDYARQMNRAAKGAK
ncbi:MAG: hypothetical protein HEQ22_17265 [Sphingopyxis sp.]|uniref:hypothetical protein n=1 Tax=Sphingopyxis sp. TaxID=1908224 RepID=UPI003D8115BA